MADTIRVLYVDDDTTALSMRADRLADHDRIEVVTESTVTDGLERLAGDDLDCVLSDVEMPNLDGIDFLERVRERDLHLPFVLFGTNPSADLVETALAARATDVIAKNRCTSSYSLLTHRIVTAVDHYRLKQRLDVAKAGAGTS